MPNMPSWNQELEWSRGARHRLCGILVFHDFPWLDVFPDYRIQFRNGMRLAQLAQAHCPSGKTPALLLTPQPAAQEGYLTTDDYHIVVVNIDRYIAQASGNAATTYFSMLSPVDPVEVASLDWSEMTNSQFLALLESRLDVDGLRSWLEAEEGRAADLVRVLRGLPVDLAPLLEGREQEALLEANERLGEDFWEELVGAVGDLPLALAHRRLWSERLVTVESLEEHLDDSDWTEPRWQSFLEENAWLLGYGLSFQFLHLLQDHPWLGGRDLSGSGGQEGDFLVASDATVGFTALVEIKQPRAELVSQPYRNRVCKLGADLTGGVAQLQQQCWRWAVESSRNDRNRDHLESQGIFTHEPRGILVIGNTASLQSDRDRRMTFESFRRSLRQPEILAFDELLRRAKHTVEVQLNGGLAEPLGSPDEDTPSD